MNKQRRRAKIAGNGGSYSKSQWEECLRFFDYKCAYTGEEIIDSVLHREHIVPINNGGTNFIWNICPSSASANFSKQDTELETWYREQPYFSEERLTKIYEWMDYAYNKFRQAVA